MRACGAPVVAKCVSVCVEIRDPNLTRTLLLFHPESNIDGRVQLETILRYLLQSLLRSPTEVESMVY